MRTAVIEGLAELKPPESYGEAERAAYWQALSDAIDTIGAQEEKAARFELDERGISACVKYLAEKDWEDVRIIGNGFVTGVDDDVRAIVKCLRAENEFADAECAIPTRAEFERVMLAEPDESDETRKYRFDVIILVVLDEKRGFIRHQKDVLNED